MNKFNISLIILLLIRCSSNNSQVIDYQTNGKKETYVVNYKFSWNFNYNCDFESKSFSCISYMFALDASPNHPFTVYVLYSIKNKYIDLVVGSGGDGFFAYGKDLRFTDEDVQDKRQIKFVKWKNNSIEIKTPSIQFLLEENSKDQSIHIWFAHSKEICSNIKICTNEIVTYINELPETIHIYRFGNNQTDYFFNHSDSSYIKKVFLFFGLLFS